MDNQGSSPKVPPKKVTVAELAEAWKNFKPVVPLNFTLARIQAIRNKYR